MSRKIGVLVVHGIGSQKQGETLHNLLKDIVKLYPGATLHDKNERQIEPTVILNERLSQAVLKEGNWQVRFYEVHWASILSGEAVKGTYSKFIFEETTWFPWFNWKYKVFPANAYSRLLIYWRVLQLWLLGCSALILNELISKHLRDKVFDQIVSDVTNYAHSMVGYLRKDSPLEGASEEILTCFRSTGRKAAQEGCNEIQIIAHSLGTVIAFNALTRYGANISETSNYTGSKSAAAIPITSLYTLGSPLEKFLFIWNKVIRPCQNKLSILHKGSVIAEAKNLQWHNYHSPFDLVSGKLIHYNQYAAINNHHVKGLGGLINAHMNYFLNPYVLSDLGASLGGNPTRLKRNILENIKLRITYLLETLLLPILLVIALALGIALYLLFGATLVASVAIVLFLFNLVLSIFQISLPLASIISWYGIFVATMIFPALLYFFTNDGYARAKKRHQRSWRH